MHANAAPTSQVSVFAAGVYNFLHDSGQEEATLFMSIIACCYALYQWLFEADRIGAFIFVLKIYLLILPN